MASTNTNNNKSTYTYTTYEYVSSKDSGKCHFINKKYDYNLILFSIFLLTKFFAFSLLSPPRSNIWFQNSPDSAWKTLWHITLLLLVLHLYNMQTHIRIHLLCFATLQDASAHFVAIIVVVVESYQILTMTGWRDDNTLYGIGLLS